MGFLLALLSIISFALSIFSIIMNIVHCKVHHDSDRLNEKDRLMKQLDILQAKLVVLLVIQTLYIALLTYALCQQ